MINDNYKDIDDDDDNSDERRMIPLLRGIRILELSAVVMGPFAGQILADLGADVVKVEPLDGDIARSAHPQTAGMGALFANNNRNKRVIALDLKTVKGKEVLTRLIERNDVLLHNMRRAAAGRLGVDFAAASEINPRLIYCSAIGFGQNGRYHDRPAFDDVIQAASGLAGLAQEDGGEPRFIPTILADKIGALHAVYGILAALVARANGHTDAIHVEAPMFEALASFVLNEHLAEATFEAEGQVGYPRILSPHRRPYRTLDGWIAVLPYTAGQWRKFLVEIGREDVIAEPWFAESASRSANVDELYRVVVGVLPLRRTDEWITTLSALDIPCSKITRIADLLHDPHLADVGFFDVDSSYPPEIKRMLPQPVNFSGIPPHEDRPPPTLGADTRVVLADCGYSEPEIDQMINAGAALAVTGTA